MEPASRKPLPAEKLRALSVEAGVDPRTIQFVLDMHRNLVPGRQRQHGSHERAERVLRKAGLIPDEPAGK